MENFINKAVIDGGMSSCLEEMELNFQKDPLWTARYLKTNTQAVMTVHKKYLEAGADIILTNTYQATVSGFQKHLHVSENEALKLIAVGAKLAIETRNKFWSLYQQGPIPRVLPLVAGSVGPYGAWLNDGSEYTGNYIENLDTQDVVDWHKPRIKTLLEAGVDILALETMPCSQEPLALAAMLEELHPESKAYVTFQSKDGIHTSHGESLREAAEKLCSYKQIIGVGVNCVDPSIVLSCLQQFKSLKRRLKVIVYPNSGELWSSTEQRFYGDVTLDYSSDVITSWFNGGADWIGGCCRVCPRHIKQLRSIVDLINKSSPT